ncbi:putative U5 snRNP-specific protein [Guillardia theta]|uniref:U5 snRNP-specific protein n=2 Tax=Guillardia theta TaxID=55529 RepID=Q9AVX9_GUITH|nr:putative U5 snRNP-specific protein [Guillardia theta]CAC27092.1 putative U5 snRNP-specific protein [Guillardia theta]
MIIAFNKSRKNLKSHYFSIKFRFKFFIIFKFINILFSIILKYFIYSHPFNQKIKNSIGKKSFLRDKNNIFRKKFKNRTEVYFINNLLTNYFDNEFLFFLPKWIIKLSNLQKLNYIQKKIVPTILGNDKNFSIISPTGTGKTFIAKLGIFRVIINCLFEIKKKFYIDKIKFKILFIIPNKSLIKEILVDIKKTFKFNNLKTIQINSDFYFLENKFKSANIIISTPEKFDLLLNNFGPIKIPHFNLVYIDEIHMISNDSKSNLEKILNKLKYLSNCNKKSFRVISSSATFPNFIDLSKFLNIDPRNQLFYFSNFFKNNYMKNTFVGMNLKSTQKNFKFSSNKYLIKKIIEILVNNKKNKILIFVNNRLDTFNLALFIIKKLFHKNYFENNLMETYNFRNPENLINKFFICIHHGGMNVRDKNISENKILEENIRIMISTATLSSGVNLPITHVIIKDVFYFSKELSNFIEIKKIDLLQMLGRCRKYTENNLSEGVVICPILNLNNIVKIDRGLKPINCNFSINLNELLIYQIRKKVYIFEIILFISNLFFSIRLKRILIKLLKKNYRYLFFKIIFFFVSKTLLYMINTGFIYKKKNFFNITYFGRIALKHSINFHSAYNILFKVNSKFSFLKIFDLLVNLEEFEKIILKKNELVDLFNIEKHSIFVSQFLNQDNKFKVSVLLIAILNKINLKNPILLQELIFIYKTSLRALKFLIEIAKINKYLYTLENILYMERCVKYKNKNIRKNSDFLYSNFLFLKNNYNNRVIKNNLSEFEFSKLNRLSIFEKFNCDFPKYLTTFFEIKDNQEVKLYFYFNILKSIYSRYIFDDLNFYILIQGWPTNHVFYFDYILNSKREMFENNKYMLFNLKYKSTKLILIKIFIEQPISDDITIISRIDFDYEKFYSCRLFQPKLKNCNINRLFQGYLGSIILKEFMFSKCRLKYLKNLYYEITKTKNPLRSFYNFDLHNSMIFDLIFTYELFNKEIVILINCDFAYNLKSSFFFFTENNYFSLLGYPVFNLKNFEKNSNLKAKKLLTSMNLKDFVLKYDTLNYIFKKKKKNIIFLSIISFNKLLMLLIYRMIKSNEKISLVHIHYKKSYKFTNECLDVLFYTHNYTKKKKKVIFGNFKNVLNLIIRIFLNIDLNRLVNFLKERNISFNMINLYLRSKAFLLLINISIIYFFHNFNSHNQQNIFRFLFFKNKRFYLISSINFLNKISRYGRNNNYLIFNKSGLKNFYFNNVKHSKVEDKFLKITKLHKNLFYKSDKKKCLNYLLFIFYIYNWKNLYLNEKLNICIKQNYFYYSGFLYYDYNIKKLKKFLAFFRNSKIIIIREKFINLYSSEISLSNSCTFRANLNKTQSINKLIILILKFLTNTKNKLNYYKFNKNESLSSHLFKYPKISQNLTIFNNLDWKFNYFIFYCIIYIILMNLSDKFSVIMKIIK